MSYVPPRRDALIVFEEGHQFYGAEVTLSLDVPAAVLFELQDFADATGQQRQNIVSRFGDEVLVDWNLDAPANGEGLVGQSLAFINALFTAWVENQSLDAPLVEPSRGTTQSAQGPSTLRALASNSRPARRAR